MASLRIPCASALLLAMAGCNTHQSALAPFGRDAGQIATISWVLLGGAIVIYAAVALLAVLAFRAPEGRLSLDGGMRLVLWAGAIVPTIVLGAVLVWSLPAMRPAPVTPATLRIAVTGEQFWWRVRYRPAGAVAVDGANEIRLPAGRDVALDVTGADVLHSLWIPGLAGKMDMIPGRTNRLVVRADRPGRYRGVCAEFCGLSHALMAFDVVVVPAIEFDRWLADAARPMAPATGEGATKFAAYGCGACHVVAGTPHAGRIGPDLTAMGTRATVAAGILPMTTENVARFVRAAPSIKPGSRMPAFPHMPPADALAIAGWLKGLQ